MGFDRIISYDYHDPEIFAAWELSLGSNINVGVESLLGPSTNNCIENSSLSHVLGTQGFAAGWQHEVESRFPKTD